LGTLAFEKSETLFGADSTQRIVAVEPAGDETMRIYIRNGQTLTNFKESFSPFLLVEDEHIISDFNRPFQLKNLDGGNEFRRLVIFNSWADCLKARSYLRKRAGQTPSSPQARFLFLSDPVHQFLLFTGKTLFKGLPFKEVCRMAIDIETACAPGYEFSNPIRKQDRIISIAIMDETGRSDVLFGRDMDEKEMLIALGDRITTWDPDIILGHNVFNFDLDYISHRARMHGLRLRWGRDGSEPRIRRSRFAVAERLIDYNRMEIFGRHVVDTLFLLLYYDVSARELESYGLKEAASYFGITTEDRVYINGNKIQWYYDYKPDLLKKYNLDDVKETLSLYELLGSSFYLQTRIFPFSFQNIFVRGNATKINALFLREYLRRRSSVPKPKGKKLFEGGYTDVFIHGVVQDVVHCDVASLYPSILLSYQLRPAKDTIGVFLPLLRDLRNFRLEAKTRAKVAKSVHDRDYYEALQQTFKILINSFYGYLGTELHHFSDPEIAAEVTRRGRELIRKMLDWLTSEGAQPVEIDTDGIYFVPPPHTDLEKTIHAFVKRLSESLPEGIEVELDGRYRAMFSYKRKNYALLDLKGNMIIRGSALRSRGMEKYLREFLSSLLRLQLEGKATCVAGLLQDYLKKLANHEMDVMWFAKTETLSESLDSYEQKVRSKKRNPAASYELALASGRPYRAGDQISYYVTGNKKRVRVYENCKLAASYDPASADENVPYYQEKLLTLFKKFKEFVPGT
jgi:DNA polymerase elongation subunit (family B)